MPAGDAPDTVVIGSINVDGIKFNDFKQRRLRRTNVDYDARLGVPRIHILGLQEVSGGPQNELTEADKQRIVDNTFPGARAWIGKHVLIALDPSLDDCTVHRALISSDERELLVDVTMQEHRLVLLNVYMDGGDAAYRVRQLRRIAASLQTPADLPHILFGDWNMVIDLAVDAVGSTTNAGGGTLQEFIHEQQLLDMLSAGQYGLPRDERRITDMTWAPRGKRLGPVVHKRLDFFLLNVAARALTSANPRDSLRTTPPWFTIPDHVSGACTGKHTDHSTVTLAISLRQSRARDRGDYMPKRISTAVAQTLLDGVSFVPRMRHRLSEAVGRMRDQATQPQVVQVVGDKAIDAIYRDYVWHRKRVQKTQAANTQLQAAIKRLGLRARARKQRTHTEHEFDDRWGPLAQWHQASGPSLHWDTVM